MPTLSDKQTRALVGVELGNCVLQSCVMRHDEGRLVLPERFLKGALMEFLPACCLDLSQKSQSMESSPPLGLLSS
eukprot:437277-Amphidinium_carterae.1